MKAKLDQRFCKILEGLEETLGELEEQRKRELPRVILIGIFFVILFSLFPVLFFSLTSPTFWKSPASSASWLNTLFNFLITAVMFACSLVFLFSQKGESFMGKFFLKNYVNSFKSEVIKKIFGLLGSNVVYAPNKSISSEQFYESLLFGDGSQFESFNGDDLTEIQIVLAKTVFSELHVSRRSGKHTVSIFDGLFFVVDMKKLFNTPVGTRPTVGKQHIKTDNPEFNKYFDIYSDDRISVFEALSNSFLEKLIEFKNKNDVNFDFSLVGNKAYFAIHYPSEMTLFEPPIWKTLFNPDIYENFLLDIQLIYDLIETLELEK